jgi:predicted transcriptional regulator of viral defense system
VPGELPKTSKYATESAVRRLDEAIARLAARQHGVVALAQLVELGLSESGVRDRVASGRLHRLHAGVYAVGHRVLKRQGHWMAAVLACGGDAALSHRTAAAALGIRPTAQSRIEVTSPRRCQRPGIHAHVARLAPAELTVVDRIPCATVARTLLDLATVLDRQGLEKAINEAEILELFDLRAVGASLERAGPRRGTRALRKALADLDPHKRKRATSSSAASFPSAGRRTSPSPR